MKDTDIRTFFEANAADISRTELNRTVSAITRPGIKTMETLCAMTPEQIGRIKNIGAKTLDIILMFRDKYLTEKQEALLSGGTELSDDDLALVAAAGDLEGCTKTVIAGNKIN